MNLIKLGDITVTWFGHASFMITDGKMNIYIDPYVLPSSPEKADLILVTHEHFDHFDAGKIKKLGTKEVAGPAGVIEKLGFGIKVKSSDDKKFGHIRVRPAEAYNVNKFRSPGQLFHPRGLGVGYIIEIGGKSIYHAGDTDNIPEMASLGSVDAALLPIGGTYTMTMQEASEAAKIIKSKVLVPMHYNSDKYGVSGINADPNELKKLLAGRATEVVVLQPMV